MYARSKIPVLPRHPCAPHSLQVLAQAQAPRLPTEKPVEEVNARAFKRNAVLTKDLWKTFNLKGKLWCTKQLLKSNHLSNETKNQAQLKEINS